MSRSVLSFVVVLSLTSCGPSAAPAPEVEEETQEATADTAGGESEHPSARELLGINPPGKPWSEMTHEERQMDMIGRFLPIFAEVFQEYDAEHYAAFDCASCHGSDMQARAFAMPSTELPPVPLAGTPAYQEMAAAHPEDMRFMEEVVTPTMQTMLGMGATFTCNGCHPVAD